MWPAVSHSLHKVSRKNEDFCMTATLTVLGVPVTLFGVFDGHGGQQTASEVNASFARVFVEEMDAAARAAQPASPPRQPRETFAACLDSALASTFARLDDACKARFSSSGTTASVVIIAREESRPLPTDMAHRVFVTVANVGDSHVILDTDSGVHELSTDHRAGKIKAELRRIDQAGGKVERDDASSPLRLYPGGLMVTRSLGDVQAPQAIHAPSIRHIALRVDPKQGGGRFIIASDGLWDAVALKEAASLVRGKRAAASASQFLTKETTRREGRNGDDVTVFVVDLSDDAASPWMPTPPPLPPPQAPRVLKWTAEDATMPVLARAALRAPRPAVDEPSPLAGQEVVIHGSQSLVDAVEGGLVLLHASEWTSSQGWARPETIPHPRTASQEDLELAQALQQSLGLHAPVSAPASEFASPTPLARSRRVRRAVEPLVEPSTTAAAQERAPRRPRKSPRAQAVQPLLRETPLVPAPGAIAPLLLPANVPADANAARERPHVQRYQRPRAPPANQGPPVEPAANASSAPRSSRRRRRAAAAPARSGDSNVVNSQR